MIPFFVGYGVLMCLSAFRGRRQTAGVLTVILGTLGLFFIGGAYLVTAKVLKVDGAEAVALIIYLPYIVMVFAISAWFASLPRVNKHEGKCIRCRYDLRGLEGVSHRCPECGYAPRTRYGSSSVAEYQQQKWGLAAQEPDQPADGEHEHRQAEHERPPQRSKL